MHSGSYQPNGVLDGADKGDNVRIRFNQSMNVKPNTANADSISVDRHNTRSLMIRDRKTQCHTQPVSVGEMTPRAKRQHIIDYMEALPFEKRYPSRPLKPLDMYNRAADNMQKEWKNCKGDPQIGRNTMIDFIQK